MELGSEYNLALNDLNVTEDNIFRYLSDYKHSYYFDSGRSALKHISRQLSQDSIICLPEFICESVANCFDKSQVQYYKLNDDFSININDLRTKIKNGKTIIFLMHYFGSIQPKETLSNVRLLADNNNAFIIEDTTHSIFSNTSTIGDCMICSIRKWLPISNGGILYYNNKPVWLNNPIYSKTMDNRKSYGMILKDLFLETGFSCNKEYRAIFADSEKKLDIQNDIYMMSDFAQFVASCFSIEEIKHNRKNNYKLLADELEHKGLRPAIDIKQSEVPFVYPFRSRNRDKLRSFLIDKQIYCAVHWPFDGSNPSQRPFARINAETLISLPIDQRYDEAHIRYMAQSLEQYGGDLLYCTLRH